jgi:rhodanese-related sulfurtransferase
MGRFFWIGFLLIALSASAQYKEYNVLYKTVYLDDLCTAFEQQPGCLLLDVRSKGEYSDTSANPLFNIGYFENAINIDVQDLEKRWQELSGYKNKPVFVYCSHSIRSRRAAALLARHGFTRVFNINEGLTGIINRRDRIPDCTTERYGTHKNFSFIGPFGLASLLQKSGKAIVFDLRGDSAFKGIAAEEIQNAYGNIRGAIPVFSLEDQRRKLAVVPKKKTIVLIDARGLASIKLAQQLAEDGYTDVRVLLEGMENWMNTGVADCPGKSTIGYSFTPYKVIAAPDLETWIQTHPGYLIIDLRDIASFQNKSKEQYRNRGHIKDAVNIPADALKEVAASWSFAKDRPILLYNFSNQPETYSAAKMLARNGFSNVAVLAGGLYNLLWQAANIKGREALLNRVADIPANAY